MRKTKFKNRTCGSNAVDPATSAPCWGKSPYKRYLGVAGKGGKTTNAGGSADA